LPLVESESPLPPLMPHPPPPWKNFEISALGPLPQPANVDQPVEAPRAARITSLFVVFVGF
jgi:hypothetical protein